MRTKRKWSELTERQQRLIVIGGVAELMVTSFALADLAKRSSDEVRGPKALWLLGFSVQPFGPLAYFAVGRKPR